MAERKIVVAGIGSGGCRIVEKIAPVLGGAASIVAIDTDSNVLSGSHVPVKLEIGSAYTRGMGAGGDVELGRKAAEDDIHMIRELFEGADAVFVMAGLGGGTGAGAAATVVSAAAETEAMTFCFATLPFQFEGPQRMAKAMKSVDDLKSCSDTLVLMPNDRLFTSTGEDTVAASFEKADRILAEGAASIWRMITRPGYISLDFADLRKAVSNSGSVCSLGFASAEGEDRAVAVMKELTASPLLGEGSVLGSAGSLLVSIAGGSDLTLNEIDRVMKVLSERVSGKAEVSMGTVIDEAFDGRISVTVLAALVDGDGGEKDKPDEPAAVTRKESGAGDSPRRKGRKASQQAKLKFDVSGQGRFRGIEPTIYEGEDLDIPTFIRRGVSIQK
ncbi:MAG: cell division protein FtsZ [Verrucomicrobiota bacterium]